MTRYIDADALKNSIDEHVYGEFHDTETNITWSVDYKGHTQKDYRKETDNLFIKRWTNEFWVDE